MSFLILLLAGAAALVLVAHLFPAPLTRLGLWAERSVSGLTLRQAKVDGASMPYLEGGQGPALLLVHGFAGDKDNFTRVARFLTPHYRVIIPDLPGFGDASRDPDADYFMADQVERLVGLLAQLDVKQVHVGGNSMGGFIAAQMAASHPALVASLWLIDPAGTEASHNTAMMHAYLATGVMPLLGREPDVFDKMVAATTHKTPWIPGFVRRTLAERAIADFTLHTAILKQLHASPLLEKTYAPMPTPALVVWGEEDEVLSPDGAASFKALFPNAQLRIMPGLGHLPMAEAPKQVAQDYLAFRATLA
jgi:pimeloyl-ACP methyl ester carboxylesterase